MIQIVFPVTIYNGFLKIFGKNIITTFFHIKFVFMSVLEAHGGGSKISERGGGTYKIRCQKHISAIWQLSPLPVTGLQI
jgi:hypothetical protein